MKRIGRKLFYVLFMILLVTAMLLMMAGPLYAGVEFNRDKTLTINKVVTVAVTAETSFTFTVEDKNDKSGSSRPVTVTLLAGQTENHEHIFVTDGLAHITVTETGPSGYTVTPSVTQTGPGGVVVDPDGTRGDYIVTFTNTLTTATFTVTFDKNGGDTNAIPQTISGITSGGTVTLPTQPTWAGYTFNGWKDGGNNTFDATTPVTADITVYAQWTEVEEGTYTVTFDKNGGDTNAIPQTISGITSGGTVTLPTQPTWAGYTFNGWKDGGNNTFDATTLVTADITVFAQWTAVAPAVAPAAAAGPAVYTITASTEGPGSITDPGVFNISQGADKIYSITPGDGASIVDVLVNGASVGAVSSYTFLGVNSSQTIHAIFSSGGVITVAGITAAATTGGGTIQVLGIQELPRTGNNMLFYVIGFALMAIGVAFGSFFIPKALRKRGN